jgi:hypothetical protein
VSFHDNSRCVCVFVFDAIASCALHLAHLFVASTIIALRRRNEKTKKKKKKKKIAFFSAAVANGSWPRLLDVKIHACITLIPMPFDWFLNLASPASIFRPAVSTRPF